MALFQRTGLAISLSMLAIFLLLLGCAQTAGGKAEANGAKNLSIEVKEIGYTSDTSGEMISAILCSPVNASEKTAAVVLTGGDGVTAEKLRSVCEAFARKGIIALAHDNVNGSLAQNVEAVVGAVDYFEGDYGGSKRPISLWAHSAGTIFSILAAYERPDIRAFVETSGHMQIPVCDSLSSPGAAAEFGGGQCIAYLEDFPAPIYVVHGSDDTTVPLSYAQAFATRLKTLGKPYDTLYVSGGKHEFLTDREYVLDKEVAFIENNSAQ